MRPWILTAAAVNGLIAVAMGAYAAHGLATVLDAGRLGWLETAARYQMWHALALLGLAALMRPRDLARPALEVAAWAFLAGIVMFSGSLFILALTGWRGVAWVTPIGGAAYLVGWAALIWHGVAAGRSRGDGS